MNQAWLTALSLPVQHQIFVTGLHLLCFKPH